MKPIADAALMKLVVSNGVGGLSRRNRFFNSLTMPSLVDSIFFLIASASSKCQNLPRSCTAVNVSPPSVLSLACNSQYLRGTNRSISFSLSTSNASVGDCTRPTEKKSSPSRFAARDTNLVSAAPHIRSIISLASADAARL